MTRRKKWGIVLLLLPAALLVLTWAVQMVAHFVLTSSNGETLHTENSICEGVANSASACVGEEESTTTGITTKVINIISILTGFVAVLGFLPCVITGIVLLATPGK